MPDVNLGPHFDEFVQKQIEHGRFQNASDVIRAGLQLLEEHEAARVERLSHLKRQINDAFDDPRPSIPADEVFAQLEQKHTERMKAGKHGA